VHQRARDRHPLHLAARELLRGVVRPRPEADAFEHRARRGGGLAVGAAGYGVVVGGTAGSGVILLTLLMAAGVEGAAVIATDGAVSIVIGLVKMSVFGVMGAVDARVIVFALLIGIVALPGAFLARAFVARMPVHVHAAILDAVVIVGGLFLVADALRGLR